MRSPRNLRHVARPGARHRAGSLASRSLFPTHGPQSDEIIAF